jgi:hypothetical protein
MPGTGRPDIAALGHGEAPTSGQLQKLRRGEITLSEYIDICAEGAVEHLKGLVDPERLQFIQSTLREQMTTDPVLIQYLGQATDLDPEGYRAS